VLYVDFRVRSTGIQLKRQAYLYAGKKVARSELRCWLLTKHLTRVAETVPTPGEKTSRPQ
jgi:hypothetical protein